MFMRRSQLHRVEAGLREVLDERRKVPVLRDVVRDGAELQTAALGRGAGIRLRSKRGKRRDGGQAGEEIASMHGRNLPVPPNCTPMVPVTPRKRFSTPSAPPITR